ncbi:MAG: UDP-3-O-(3-hydroxymyristoyl)glucosamine N-acyltransferase [Proteobacteria bacterium]|nr:UDP-3-O-(3-hydroxymyristoyl)glucosamine N-acyltransferase [Pseudomonadota bacterium]
MPAFALKDIADALDARLSGDGAFKVERLVHPMDATSPHDLILAFDTKLHAFLENTPAKAAVLGEGQEEMGKRFAGVLFVSRPRAAMAKLTSLFAIPSSEKKGVHPSAVIDPSAKIGKNVSIGPLCYVGPRTIIGEGTRLATQVSVGADVKIGSDCSLYSGVRVAERVEIGDRVIVQFNAVIGADGFSFVTPEPGSAETLKEKHSGKVETFNTHILRIHSLGAVILSDDVEVGACSTIDRGTVTHTRIGRNTKIDNQVQIGHNASIGENCLICGNVGVAGSAQIGNRVVLAAGSGVADHVKIGDDAVLMSASQLGGNLPSKGVYLGAPAQPRERAEEQFFHIARLKVLRKRLESLEEKVNLLERQEKKG